jgi:hypothetical protein
MILSIDMGERQKARLVCNALRFALSPVPFANTQNYRVLSINFIIYFFLLFIF